jgi:DNA-binding MarR family transcriptional regulator
VGGGAVTELPNAPLDGDELDSAIRSVERSLAVLLRRARALSARIARDVHPHLDASAYGIMLRLASGEATTVTELSLALGIGKPTVSRQVPALEHLGLLIRTPAPDDRRAAQLSLTPDGAQRLAAAREGRMQAFRAVLGEWPREDIETFGRLLSRFNEHTF